MARHRKGQDIVFDFGLTKDPPLVQLSLDPSVLVAQAMTTSILSIVIYSLGVFRPFSLTSHTGLRVLVRELASFGGVRQKNDKTKSLCLV